MYNLKNEFPLDSQTTDQDKISLLKIRDVFSSLGFYKYLEIGSYLGGSIYPFARDEKCIEILSIDKRHRNVPDERGASYDYTEISIEHMLDNLKSVNAPIEKIVNFDGDISECTDISSDFDLAFIDGEHTDEACFRDFLYVDKFLKRDSIVAFHDSTLIFGALRLINVLLGAKFEKFKFIKIKNSEISLIIRGEWMDFDFKSLLSIDENIKNFYIESERIMLMSNLKNRVGVSFKINERPVIKI